MSKVVFVYFSTIYQLCRRCCKCKNEILTLSKHEKLTRGCVIYVILVPLKIIPDRQKAVFCAKIFFRKSIASMAIFKHLNIFRKNELFKHLNLPAKNKFL